MYPNWINPSLSEERLLRSKYLRLSFSQNNEDLFVITKFWKEILASQSGTYLDIGAFHPELYSNTKLLYTLGWSGIAVDANPNCRGLWMIDRPKDHFYNFAISSDETVDDSAERLLDYYVFEDGAYNSTDISSVQTAIAKGVKLLGKISVPSISLTKLAVSIMSAHPNIHIDYVSIDIEGTNIDFVITDFLETLKFPRALTLEIPINALFSDIMVDAITSPTYLSLKKLGYTIESIYGNNLYAWRSTL
jgi:hypothetical protein